MDLKLHTHLGFDGLMCTQVLKYLYLHVSKNKPHNKNDKGRYIGTVTCVGRLIDVLDKKSRTLVIVDGE